MNVEGEFEGNAKTKIFSLFMDWIGYGMSQTKLTEYQTMHQNASIGGISVLATQVCVWPTCAR